MNQSVSELFNIYLKNIIITELENYYHLYKKNISKQQYRKFIEEIVNEKFNFSFVDPIDIVYYKNLYQLKYNKTAMGRNANNIDWLKLKIKEFDYNDKIILLNENKIIKYKPRYVSRNTFNKKNKCMARLWNDHHGGQCSNNKKEGDYCMIHYKLLKKRNILQFGRIDECRPEKDYYNFNYLNWKTKD